MMSETVRRKRGFCVARGADADMIADTPGTRREKNCALSALFKTTQPFESVPTVESSLENSKESLLTAFPGTLKISRSPLKETNRDLASFHTLLDDSKVLRPLQEPSPLGSRKASYHLRKIARVADPGRTLPSCSLLNDLSLALSTFNTKIQISRINKQFDVLVEVKKLKLLAPHEILVTTASPDKTRRSIILHSVKPLQESVLSRFLYLKLAINSKCYLELCNGIIWYLKWKFF